jgi:hypothetical protein
MPVVPGSRYSDNPLAVVRVNSVPRQVINSLADVPVLISYKWYQVTEADTLDSMAYTFFGDPTKWWQIADVNPEILDWSDVAPGSLIRIPVFS